MFASRWHSPPKPLPVLSCDDRDVQVREPVGVERALDVALEHADAHAAEARPSTRSSSVVLPAPGRAHQVDDRHAVAVEVVAVGARDRVVGVERVLDDPDLHAMHASSSSTLDRLDLELLAAERPARRRRRTSGSGTPGTLELPLARRRPSQRSRAGDELHAPAARPRRRVSRATMPK